MQFLYFRCKANRTERFKKITIIRFTMFKNTKRLGLRDRVQEAYKVLRSMLKEGGYPLIESTSSDTSIDTGSRRSALLHVPGKFVLGVKYTKSEDVPNAVVLQLNDEHPYYFDTESAKVWG